MNESELQGWFTGRLPDGWFTAPPEITVDREELLVVGTLPDVDLPKDTAEPAATAARKARIERFREETRQARMRIAEEVQRRLGRKVSWGAECGGVREMFTTISVPVMTRLRQPERHVLDTLVDAGVARSRSEALAWCVRLVGRHQGDWIQQLRDALVHVEKVRSEGPDPTAA
ncbi:MAG TPA: hypothetical protein VFC09_13850 [Candidatus Dormibacteraeota bacterium]|nr:hypothetical protein [Candidatus Dormibacteraeota bacterium]